MRYCSASENEWDCLYEVPQCSSAVHPIKIRIFRLAAAATSVWEKSHTFFFSERWSSCHVYWDFQCMQSNYGVGNATKKKMRWIGTGHCFQNCILYQQNTRLRVKKLWLGKSQNYFYSKCVWKKKKKRTTICGRNSKTDDSCRKVGNQIAPCRDVMNADTLKNILAIPISAGEIRYKKKWTPWNNELYHCFMGCGIVCIV